MPVDVYTERMRAAATNAAMGMPHRPLTEPPASARDSADALRRRGFGTDASHRPPGLRVVRPQPPALMRAAVDAAAEGRLPPAPGAAAGHGRGAAARGAGRAPGRGAAEAAHPAAARPGPRGGGTADGAGGWLIALEAALALCGAFGCYAVFGE